MAQDQATEIERGDLVVTFLGTRIVVGDLDGGWIVPQGADETTWLVPISNVVEIVKRDGRVIKRDAPRVQSRPMTPLHLAVRVVLLVCLLFASGTLVFGLLTLASPAKGGAGEIGKESVALGRLFVRNGAAFTVLWTGALVLHAVWCRRLRKPTAATA